MSKRKREPTSSGVGEEEEEEDQHQREEEEEEEEEAEMERRLERRRGDESARMAELYDNFVRIASPEQLDRFEHWKRSKFPRASMRRLMGDILGSSSERGAIVLAAVAKMFVGELVEAAREQMTANGETGPIQPNQLRQAFRQSQRSESMRPGINHTPRLFWRSDCGS